MWKKAGCYHALYESDGWSASIVIPILEKALAAMLADPAAYKALEPENRWGTYEGAIGFLARVGLACKRRPLALIGVSA
jgi:hypothetical protein